MERPRFGYDGYALVGLPAVLWRVSAWHEPFDPPPPAAPLGPDPREDDGHRYDDPHGRIRSLYCATEAEGALGECLGEFAYSAAAAVRVEAFLHGDCDPGEDEDLLSPLDGADIEGFEWRLAFAETEPGAKAIDVDAWTTYLAAAPRILPELPRLGRQRLDRSIVLDRRSVTRTIAGIWYDEALDEHGDPRAAGLKFSSRLPPGWECWALWEGAGVDYASVTVDADPVRIDDPRLRTAAAMLGVHLAE